MTYQARTDSKISAARALAFNPCRINASFVMSPRRKKLDPFGERLREMIARSDRVTSRADFARKAGLVEAQLYRYEKGEYSPRLSQLTDWAQIIGCSAADLIGVVALNQGDPPESLAEFLADYAPANITPEEIDWLSQAPFRQEPSRPDQWLELLYLVRKARQSDPPGR